MSLREPFTLERFHHGLIGMYRSLEMSMFTRTLEHGFCEWLRADYWIIVQRVKSTEWEWNHAIAATSAYMGILIVSLRYGPGRESSDWINWTEILGAWRTRSEIQPAISGLYPELSMLSPATIQAAYDEYVNRCGNTLRGATIFCIALLEYSPFGYVSPPPGKNWQAHRHALLEGGSIDDARHFGIQAQCSIPLFRDWLIRYPWPWNLCPWFCDRKKWRPSGQYTCRYFRMMRKLDIDTLTATLNDQEWGNDGADGKIHLIQN